MRKNTAYRLFYFAKEFKRIITALVLKSGACNIKQGIAEQAPEVRILDAIG